MSNWKRLNSAWGRCVLEGSSAIAAAAPRRQRQARHVLLRGGHFTEDAGGDRTLQILDHMGLHARGPLVDQVDVGLRHDRSDHEIVGRYHIAEKVAALDETAGHILGIGHDELSGLIGDDGEILPSLADVCELVSEVGRLIREHLGLHAVDLPDRFQALACRIELSLDNGDLSVERRIFERDERLARCHRRAGA